MPSFGSRKVTHEAAAARRRVEPARGSAARRPAQDPDGISRASCACRCSGRSSARRSDEINQTDIVMLLTPHIVRTHELTVEDLTPIYIGTQQNVGLGGPPPLIAPQPSRNRAPAAPRRQRRHAPTPQSAAGGTATPGPRRACRRPTRRCRRGTVARADDSSAGACRRRPRRAPATPPAAAAPVRRHGPPRDVRRRSAGAAPATPPCPRDAGAGHRHAARDRVPHRRRTLHRAGLDHERVAGVDDHADGDVQPDRAARAHGAGRHVHAPGRRDGDVHAAHRRGDRTRRHRRSRAPATRPARQARACSPRCSSTRSVRAARSIQVSGIASTPEGAPIPLHVQAGHGDGAVT